MAKRKQVLPSFAALCEELQVGTEVVAGESERSQRHVARELQESVNAARRRGKECAQVAGNGLCGTAVEGGAVVSQKARLQNVRDVSEGDVNRHGGLTQQGRAVKGRKVGGDEVTLRGVAHHARDELMAARASKYCHVCARKGERIELVWCKAYRHPDMRRQAPCRKAFCKKCLDDVAAAAVAAAEHELTGRDDKTKIRLQDHADAVKCADWLCLHCQRACPPNARCKGYLVDAVRLSKGVSNVSALQPALQLDKQVCTADVLAIGKNAKRLLSSDVALPQEDVKRRRSAEMLKQHKVVPPTAQAQVPKMPHTAAQNKRPSRFCHVCSRKGERIGLVACMECTNNARQEAHDGEAPRCRKSFCAKCLEEAGCDLAAVHAAAAKNEWRCLHCREACSERAKCHKYKRGPTVDN
mmetsp:Transcript_7196/g.19283  ORF Transcript_7196/g.19283 Transcript_7196/m.19283 type:complete len:412 (+) Transcript_7196:68-1303(+)